MKYISRYYEILYIMKSISIFKKKKKNYEGKIQFIRLKIHQHNRSINLMLFQKVNDLNYLDDFQFKHLPVPDSRVD